MAKQAHLANAPITEALLDIKVRVPVRFELETLSSLFRYVSESYPVKKERHQFSAKTEMRVGQTPLTEATEAIDGFLFTSSDEKQVFQARKNGFTFNRLKPYESWETFRDEAKRLWQFYKEVVSTEVQRIGLRYINMINIPLPIADFRDYLTAAPVVPTELPQSVDSFLSRIVITEPKIDAAAIITQVFEQIVDPKLMPLFLDIDVSKQKESFDEEEIWSTFEKMRVFKNAIFFSSITDRMKELFV